MLDLSYLYHMLAPFRPPFWRPAPGVFFFQAEDGIRDIGVTGVQTCALPILKNLSGAGKFFIDFSLALMGRKRNSAGRAVVLSSFLLGGPSGSGVATTVMIGTVAAPMLAKAGFDRNAAGGLLAAGGLGAILSPPVLGAAAFLIAEFLKISYLDVI